MDAQAVGKLILQGLGAGVLPGHMVQKLEKNGEEIQTLNGSGKPLHNTISVAYLEEKTLASSTIALLEFMKSRIGK